MWMETVIYKSGQVKYKFFERYKCPYTGKLKRVSVTYSTKSKQAQKNALYELQKKIEIATSTGASSNKVFMDVMTEYIESGKAFRKYSTHYGLVSMQKAIRKMLPEEDIALSKLNTATIQLAFDEFQKTRSYVYAKALLGLIRQTLRYAHRMGYISDIRFLDNIQLHKPAMSVAQVKKNRSKFLTKAELKELLSKLNDINPPVSLICEFQSLTGLRFGELVALRIQDYDSKNKVIDVNGTLSSRGSLSNDAMRLSPKNAYSIRKVSLDARADKIINHFILANKARMLWKSNVAKNDYIFVTDGGLPYDIHFVNKIIKRTHFHKPVSTHTFRHTHISLLAEANVPLKAIMERVGHNDPRTTLAIYTHVTDEMKKEVANAINNIGNAISNK